MRMFLNLPEFWESRLLRRSYIGQSLWRLRILLRLLLVPRDPEGEPWQSHLADSRDEIHRATLRGGENSEAPCRSWLTSSGRTSPKLSSKPSKSDGIISSGSASTPLVFPPPRDRDVLPSRAGSLATKSIARSTSIASSKSTS